MNTWKIDPAHSEVKFKIKHLVISSVTGHFNLYDAQVEAPNDDFSNASVSFEADINSIDTKNEQRDGHLKSPDFFDAANFPKLSFVSKSLTKKSANAYELVGDLTIRDKKRETKLNVVHNGTVKGFGGTDVAAFEITGKMNRQDFGLTWNALTEAGGVVVGDDVKFEVTAEFNRAA